MLSLDKVDIPGIADALQDQTDYDHMFLVNSETGEIVFWSRDCGIDGKTPVDLGDLPEELIAVRPVPSYVWYGDMEDFIGEVSDEQAARRLARAVNGRGAFRRFRAELEEEYPRLLKAWYAFRDVRALRRAVEWLAEEELIGQDVLDRYLADHPDAYVP